jgi:YbgC/YbaW family acyl-CoA thioester hydrolase
MPETFKLVRRVQFHETDMAGVMYFANYFRLIEEIEQAFLKSLGYSVSMPWDGGRMGFPRVKVSCEYFGPSRFDDALTLVLRMTHIGNKSMSYEVDFTRDGDRLALGSLTGVCSVADGHGFRTIAIPDDLRAKLSPFLHAGLGPA